MKITMKSLKFLLAVAGVVALVPLASANIVANGTIDGNGSPWDLSFGATFSPDDRGGSAGSGSILFPAVCTAADGCKIDGFAFQTFAPLTNPAGYDFSFWAKGSLPSAFHADLWNGSTEISLLSGSAPVVGGWAHYSGVVADGNSSTEIDFGFLALLRGNVGDIFIDDVELVARQCVPGTRGCGNNVPEPGSLLLVGAALAAVATIRRRKTV